MENTMTSPTSQPHKHFILPGVLGTLLLVSTVIIILFATHVIGKTSNPDVKLFVGSMPASRVTFVVQVKHVSEILADMDISFFVFDHKTTSDTSYSIDPYKGKLSNFIFSKSIDTAPGALSLTITYVPKSNVFVISMQQEQGSDNIEFACAQTDSLDFLDVQPV